MRKKLQNAISASADSFVSPFLQLLLTPLLLKELGLKEFGMWALTLTICAFGPLITFATSSSAFNLMSIRFARGDVEGILKALMGGVQMIFGSCLLAILIALGIFTTSFYLIDDNYFKYTILLAVAGFVITFQEIDSLLNSSFKARADFKTVAVIDVLFRIISVASIGLAAWIFRSAILCLCVMGCVIWIKTIAKIFLYNKIYKFNIIKKNITLFRLIDPELAKNAVYHWGQAIGSTIFNAADKLMVSIFFGLEQMGIYSICNQIAQFVFGVQSSAGQAVLPWASKKVALFEKGRFTVTALRSILLKACVFGGIGSLIIPVVIGLNLDQIMKFWLGLEFSEQNYTLAISLLISYAVLCTNIPMHYILLGSGKVKAVTLLNLIAGIVYLMVAFTISVFGIIPFALSKAVYAPVTLIGIKSIMNLK